MSDIAQRLQRSAQAAISAWNNDPQMTTQMEYTQGLWNGLDAANAERLARYKLLWKYYKGEHRKHLKPRPFGGGQGPDDNVVVNLSRRVVNKGVAFLFGEPLAWEIVGKNKAESMLAAIWKSDEWRMTFLNELAVNGGVTGDFYVQIVPPTTPLSPPRLVNLNPCIVIPTVNPDDIDEVWQYEMRWRSGNSLKRTRYVFGEDGTYWDIVTEILVGSRWVSDPANPPEVWNYSWSPIIHGKNLPNPNDFFGVSDLEDADLNDAINSVTSNLNRVVRIFAHPVIWGKMFNQEELDVSKVSLAKDKDAALGALELAKDVSGAQGFAKFLSTEFSEVTQVPENDTDRMRIGAQSGFALKVLFHELVQKTNIKQALYGRVIVEACQRALELAGQGPDTSIKLHWANPLPLDEREQVASDKFDIDYGLASRQTVATRRGYDWEEEQKRRETEKVSVPVQTVASVTPGQAMAPAPDNANALVVQ